MERYQSLFYSCCVCPAHVPTVAVVLGGLAAHGDGAESSPGCAGLQPQLGGTCPAGRVKIRRSVSNGKRSAGLELGVIVCSSFGLSSGRLGQKFLRSPISLSSSIALFCCCWCLVGLLVVELLDGAGEAAVQGGEFHLSSFLLQLFCCLPNCSAYSHCVLMFSNFLLGSLQY